MAKKHKKSRLPATCPHCGMALDTPAPAGRAERVVARARTAAPVLAAAALGVAATALTSVGLERRKD